MRRSKHYLTYLDLSLRGKARIKLYIDDGDTVLVKTWIDTLKQIHYVVTNHFNELVITSDGKNYLEKFDSHR